MFNYPNKLRDQVNFQKTNYIDPGFSQAESELSGLSLPNNVYFRDIFYDVSSNAIREISTNNQIATLSSRYQFLYYPQLLQLLVRAYDYSFYP
jgi:hypothetical protein